MRADLLDPGWLDSIHQTDMPDIASASNTKLKMSGNMTHDLHMTESRTRVSLGVIGELFIPVLSWKTCIDGFVKPIHRAERKSVSYRFPQMITLLIHETGRETEMDNSDTRQEVSKELALFVTPSNCDCKYITVAGQVVLKGICETPVLVCT